MPRSALNPSRLLPLCWYCSTIPAASQAQVADCTASAGSAADAHCPGQPSLRPSFLLDLNSRNMTEWRSTWKDKALAKQKKFERVVGFFWFCVRQGWLKENPTATMGRVIAKHVPSNYFTAEEYAKILDVTYRLNEFDE
jgi:hypothetical protein